MPVFKFRDVAEMDDARWLEPGSPALFRAIARVWDLAARTCPVRFPPGVYRHRNIVAAQNQREAWEAAWFAAERKKLKPNGVNPTQ